MSSPQDRVQHYIGQLDKEVSDAPGAPKWPHWP